MFDVKSIIKKVNAKQHCNVVGIRHLTYDETYQVGDMCRNSFEWNYERDCSSYETTEPVELNGTCAYCIPGFDDFDLDEIEEATEVFNTALRESEENYVGGMVVVAGTSYTYGDDENEVIIWDAEVIATEE